MYKKYRRGANIADGIDTALSVASVRGLGYFWRWTPVNTHRAPVAIGIGAGTIFYVGCWEPVENLLAGGFKRKLNNTIRSVS